MRLYKMVAVKEGISAQFLGVLAHKWEEAWGEPDCGFIGTRTDDTETNIFEQYQDVLSFLERAQRELKNIMTIVDEAEEELDIDDRMVFTHSTRIARNMIARIRDMA